MSCATCKHWDETNNKDYAAKGYGICRVITLNRDMSKSESDPEEIPLGELPAFTEDGSGYKADLFTLPMFHCSMYKDKSDAPN